MARTTLSDLLPRRIPGRTTEQCAALDSDGRRCVKRAEIEDTYHGDHEMYGWPEYETHWVRVAFCLDHFKRSRANAMENLEQRRG